MAVSELSRGLQIINATTAPVSGDNEVQKHEQSIRDRPGSISCMPLLYADDDIESCLKLGTERRRFGVVERASPPRTANTIAFSKSISENFSKLAGDIQT